MRGLLWQNLDRQVVSLVISNGKKNDSRLPKQMRYRAALLAEIVLNYSKLLTNAFVVCISNTPSNSAHKCSEMQANEGGYCDKIWTVVRLSVCSPLTSIDSAAWPSSWHQRFIFYTARQRPQVRKLGPAWPFPWGHFIQH